MVKVVRKAVGMTPVVDLIRAVAAPHPVAHAPVAARTARHTVIANPSLAGTVAKAGQTVLHMATRNHSLVETVAKVAVTARHTVIVSHSTEIVDRIGQHTVIANRSLAGTVAKAEQTANRSTGIVDQTARHTATKSPSIGRVGQIGQHMVTENRSLAGTVAMADRIANRSLVGIVVMAGRIARHTVTVSHSIEMVGQTVPHMATRNHLLVGTVAKVAVTARHTVIVSHSIEMVDRIGQHTVTANRSLAGTVVRAEQTASRSLAGTVAMVDHAKEDRIARLIMIGTAVTDQPNHVNHLLAETAGATGQQAPAKVIVPVLIAVTAQRAPMTARNVNPLTGIIARKMAQIVHSSVKHPLAMTAPTRVKIRATTRLVLTVGMKEASEPNAPKGNNSTGAIPTARLVHARPATGTVLTDRVSHSPAGTVGIRIMIGLTKATTRQ